MWILVKFKIKKYENISDMIFGANVMCLIFNLLCIFQDKANSLNYLALVFLVIYFILEIPRRVFDKENED